jgi:hypothetical protein
MPGIQNRDRCPSLRILFHLLRLQDQLVVTSSHSESVSSLGPRGHSRSPQRVSGCPHCDRTNNSKGKQESDSFLLEALTFSLDFHLPIHTQAQERGPSDTVGQAELGPAGPSWPPCSLPDFPPASSSFQEPLPESWVGFKSTGSGVAYRV